MRRSSSTRKEPTAVPIPNHVPIQPAPGTPPEILAFFGKTGRWWGTWESPQTKGGYDVILVVNEIYCQEDRWEARVTYASADYPAWYVNGGIWENVGTFSKKPNGKTILSVASPMAGVMEFWFETNSLRGRLSMRFTLSRITMKPLL